MSVKATTMVWDHYPNGGGEFLTALCLADHADHEGGCIFPSVARIATKTQPAERTIQYHLAAMRESGWLIKVSEGGGAGNPAEYRIPIERISKELSTRVQRLHPLPGGEGCNDSPKRVQKSAEKGATAIAPEQVLTVNRTTPAEKDQGQNQAKHCARPSCTTILTAGHTRTKIGDICHPCYQAYLAGEWDYLDQPARPKQGALA